jgi:outer membrane protein OmpA-like peptidoglycan-associated protein
MKNRTIYIVALCFIVFNIEAQTKLDSTAVKNQQLINGIKNRINTIENIGNPNDANSTQINELKAKLKVQQDTIAYLKKIIAESTAKYTKNYINSKSNKELNAELNNSAVTVKNLGLCNCVRLFFKPYQTVLNYKEFNSIDSIVSLLHSKPSAKLKIEGHADKSGAEKINVELSKKRVLALKEYLLNTAKVGSDKIITEWHGSAMPNVDATSADSQFLNRRIEIILFD